MKITVAQTRPLKGDIVSNVQQHADLANKAALRGSRLIVFSELSLTGYEPTLANGLATTKNDRRLDALQELSDSKQIAIGAGIPTIDSNGIYISMIIFQPRMERRVYSKRYIHADEEQFFACGKNFPVMNIGGRTIGLSICYELSIPAHIEAALNHGADTYISSSVKSTEGISSALARLQDISHTYSIPALFSNSVGFSDGFQCAGRSSVWDSKGNLLSQLDELSEGMITYDTVTNEVEITYFK